jgi:HSP20 family protein
MLARWNPWQELMDMEREMSGLTRRLLGSDWYRAVHRGGEGTTWAPAVDMFARNGDLVVRAELPGVDPDRDIDISLQDGMLTIKGERRHQEKADGENYYRVESSYGSFQRSIPLPEKVKADDVKAAYQDGILEVVVPKAGEPAAARKIPISVGSGRKALTTKTRKS